MIKLNRFLPVLLAIPLMAQAAVPTEVTDAITTAGADLVTVATAVLTALVGFWALAKVGKKMGWW